MRTQCTQAGGSCQKDWYADEGELVITEIGDGVFAGEFKNIVFKEVTIDPTLTPQRLSLVARPGACRA